MTTLKIAHPADVAELIDRQLPPSSWVTLDQATIDRFAEATGDYQWIHVDTARAEREMPGGKTIEHGYLTLALLPRLAAEISIIENLSKSLNYGSDRVRFTNAAPVGSRVRLQKTFKSVEKLDNGGYKIVADCVMEIEGADRPALVAEVISLAFP